MRELGVLVWCDIQLGPEPSKPPLPEATLTPEQLAAEAHESKRAKYEELLNSKISDAELERLP